jgi:prepilin-type N-terminal cleavage/methylation domain-containing protein
MKFRGRNAFTLIEVLVATSVLTLMMLMITALMNSASLTVSSSGRHLAADDQARQVFDRMQVDFARMVRRNDVYFNFNKPATGNDSFTFYTEMPGYFSNNTSSAKQSNTSLVSYQIPVTSQLNSQTLFLANNLCRLGQGNQWTEIAFTPTANPNPSITGADLLSNSIFRLETAFLYRTGDTSLQISSTPPTPGSGIQNLEAVVVALGVLDTDSQKIVPSGEYPTLVAALAKYTGSQSISLTSSTALTAPSIDPILSTWRTAISASNFATTAGIPASAARQVRVYQRIIYLQ